MKESKYAKQNCCAIGKNAEKKSNSIKKSTFHCKDFFPPETYNK